MPSGDNFALSLLFSQIEKLEKSKTRRNSWTVFSLLNSEEKYNSIKNSCYTNKLPNIF